MMDAKQNYCIQIAIRPRVENLGDVTRQEADATISNAAKRALRRTEAPVLTAIKLLSPGDSRTTAI